MTSSVAWVGAAVVFLALAVVGLTSQDERTVRGAYLVMDPAAWFVLVPLAHASLLSGIVLSLGTSWGLLRHYWVVLKLSITVFSTVILLIYMGTFRQMAGVAADPLMDFHGVRNPSPMVHSILALILLLTATVVGVYKPLGLTAYGRRKQDEQREVLSSGTTARRLTACRDAAANTPRWIYFSGVIAMGILLLLALLHLSGYGPSH